MFCPNCGNKLTGNEQFCSNCGFNMINANNEQNTTSLTESISAKSKSVIGSLVKKIKDFFKNNKKLVLIIVSVLAVLIVGIVLFANLFGFEKLMWDEGYEITQLEYVTQTKVEISALLGGKVNDEVKYKTNCGKTKISDGIVTWDLSQSTGECKITAVYKLRKKSKKVIVLSREIEMKELALEYEIDMDSDEDLDFDGLTNKQEKEYKTNAIVADSDMDGLDDNYEISTIKTDPNKKDSDNDGLSDFDEIKLELDPLKDDSKGDGVKDGKRTLTYNYAADRLKLSITGTGNIASTVAEIDSNTKISGKVGLIDNLYTFYTDGTISEAVVTITYTDDELVKYGLNEDNLSIYYYNENEAKYEKIETIVDKVNNTLTATLKHFSNYVVGDTSLVKETINNQVLFVLDNSWSMYNNDQYENITGKKYSGELDGFDAEGVRFTLTSTLITKLINKNYEIGLSEFRRDYANALKIGSDEKSLKSKLNSMNGSFITSTEGTDIGSALYGAIDEFSSDGDNRYIVILTDGQDSGLKYETEDIIEDSLEKGVKICSVGFGGGSYNTELENISNGTGCQFYSSSDANGLSELFENIGAELNDNLIDIDEDGKNDGRIVADSGFIVNRDGFSFGNYGLSGHCYGMATFAQLYYKNVLPLTFCDKTVGLTHKSYAYDLNDTYFDGTDNLYDFELTSEALKFGFIDVFPELQPLDFREVKRKKLVIKDKYKEEAETYSLYNVDDIDTSISEEEQIKKYGFTYKKVEAFDFDDNKLQKTTSLTDSEFQMFNAIQAGFIRQFATTHYISGTDYIVWLRNVFGQEDTEEVTNQTFINILKNRISDKDVPVISANYSNGIHAVNAISLVQDIENPNYYYIGVYDNNYPGEKRYVDIECKEGVCLTVANDYYKNSNQPIRITPSLAYDLEYFQQ